MEIYRIDGKEFTNINDIAADLGVSRTTFKRYIESEGSVEAAYAVINEKNKVFSWRGEFYPSINALAPAVGIERTTLTRLLKPIIGKGLKETLVVDDIIDEYVRQRELGYKYQGKVYGSLKEAAEAAGTTQSTLSRYLKMAKEAGIVDNDIDKAIEVFRNSKVSRNSEVIAVLDGVQYTSRNSIADALGVNRKTFIKYIESEGSIEAAYEKIKELESEVYEWNGKIYKSLNALATAMGIPRPTLKRIMEVQTNGDYAKAYELYMERNSGKYYGYTYKGVKYDSIKDMLESLGLSYKRYERLLPKYENDIIKTVDALVQMKEQKELEEEERARIEEQKQLDKATYFYKGVEYPSKVALAKELGISETSMGRALEGIEKKGAIITDSYIEQYLDDRYTYTYHGQTFPSIKALADYLGMNELRLGRYIRKYDRDAEKAIMIIRERDKQQKKLKVGDAEVDLADLATILEIKQSALRGYISRGMTIDDIRKRISEENSVQVVGKGRGKNIMYDETTSLLEFCIKNRLNYNCIYYAITEYGKTMDEAIAYYRTNGQRLPITWIHERYGVLLKHLMLNESVDYKKVLFIMRDRQMSLREAIEHLIVREDAKENNLDTIWQHEIYSLLTDPSVTDEEREEIIETFHVTPKEMRAVNKSKERADGINRRLLIYELAECIRDNTFSDSEMAELMNLYEVSDNELKIMFYDFYVHFQNGILLTENQQKNMEADSRLKKAASEKIEYFMKLMHGNKDGQDTSDPDAGDIDL